MITAALEFLHARKWLIELLLVLGIVGAVWWGCSSLIERGVNKQKAADDVALAKLQIETDNKTAELQRRATAAEAAHVQESADLAAYVSANPLHGSLCKRADGGPGRLSAGGTLDVIHAGPGPAPGDLQPVSAGDSGVVGQPDPDIRGMLDLLAYRADTVSAELREYRARN